MAEKVRLPIAAEEVMNFTHEQRVELAELVAGLLADAGIGELRAVELYGSVAKNQDGKRSDIDLLITHDGDHDGWEFMKVAMLVYETLTHRGVPVSDWWDKKEAAAGKVSLVFEADEVYRDPMSYYGRSFPITGFDEMDFLGSVRRSAKELWRK